MRSSSNAIKLSKQSTLKDVVSRSFDGKVRDAILKDNRDFICEGDLSKIDRFSRNKLYRFFLFSDYLYYAESAAEKKKEDSGARKSFITADDIIFDNTTSHDNVK